MAEIHPADRYDEKHHRSSMPNEELFSRYGRNRPLSGFEWAQDLSAPIRVEPRKLLRLSSLAVAREGSLFCLDKGGFGI
ncbi:hypothetical protein AU377_01895 [Sporosarcina sp. HYO08]|nr:hypothetical protein AU377_01895 [Sporosarcina sp. HYO08]